MTPSPTPPDREIGGHDAEGRRHRGLWLCEASMKPAWAKKKALARLLGQRFLEAGVGSDELLWNRNVTLEPAPDGKVPATRDEA